MFDRLVRWFMPAAMRDDVAHAKYHEFRVVVSACLIGVPLVLLFPLVFYFAGVSANGYLVNAFLLVITLLSVRYCGHYRVPMGLTAIVTYFLVYGWIRDSGLIYSSNVSVLHMYLLGAIWADKRYGWWAIFSNLALFGFIYHRTLEADLPLQLQGHLGSPLYALLMNCLITVFFGGFLAYLQLDSERDRIKIKDLQDKKINMLDEVVKQRTEQLNSMRESIATDFHDETGNMLSAITRQAAVLKQQLSAQDGVRPIVRNIIENCDRLYSASKDFLWHLHYNSDHPGELFDHLTAHGQNFYNQFDIDFSSERVGEVSVPLPPSAALNIIYIFKEAMTNVIKHSGAQEVIFMMHCTKGHVTYSLLDNGSWKEADDAGSHFGLVNMQRRCAKNSFDLKLDKRPGATCIAVTIATYDRPNEKENSDHRR